MIKKLKQPIDQYFDLTSTHAGLVEKMLGIQTVAFIRGEISALEWVRTCKSLAESDLKHIDDRIKTLKDGLNGKEFDRDPTQSRAPADFDSGEAN